MAGISGHEIEPVVPGLLPDPEAFAALLAEYDRALSANQRTLQELQARILTLTAEIEHKNRLLARQERLAALGEMAAGVAHEIRNPLGGISLYVEMLESDVSENEAAVGLCRKVANAVSRLNHTVEAILGFTRTLEPQIGPIELPQLVDDVVSMARPVMEPRGLRAELRADGDAGWVSADHGLVHQLLLNLVRNAAEASPNGGVVEIGCRREKGCSELWVRDSGHGIQPEMADRLFTPFSTNKKGGTGLGLAFCQRIAEAHGGSIAASNHRDGGAVFTVRLPLHQSE